MFHTRILVADDDKDTCEYIKKQLDIEKAYIKKQLGIELEPEKDIDFAHNLDEALNKIKVKGEKGEIGYDIMIVDLWMPNAKGILDKESGMKILEEAKSKTPSPEVIIITGHSSADSALRAMRIGAYDYIMRPINYSKLVDLIKKSLEKRQLERQFTGSSGLESSEYEIIGESEKMIEIMKAVGRIANSDSVVLIEGESGTGKDLIARAIHTHSPRSSAPFIPVNCSAIPKDLIEAELFGIGKRVATEVDSRPGVFMKAQGGTLFLDEIGEVALDVQPKLLRAIEQKELQKVGEDVKKVDVRIIAATNKDLRKAVADGTFRQDLYYRLQRMLISLPPLRERVVDIPLLAKHLLRKYSKRLGKDYIQNFDDDAIAVLQAYSWPGNIRELENAVEYATTTCNGKVVSKYNLPPHILTMTEIQEPEKPFKLDKVEEPSFFSQQDLWNEFKSILSANQLKEAERRFEKFYLQYKLKQNDWNITNTAKSLDLARPFLHKKIKKHGIKRINTDS